MNNTFYLVGLVKGGDFPNTLWEFCGLFSTMNKAIQQCKTANHFYVEVYLDEEIKIEKDDTVVGSSIKWEVTFPYARPALSVVKGELN